MYRLQGSIKRVSTAPKIFGVIVGDDQRDYFFIPSLMRVKSEFFRLREGLRVEFESTVTDTGLRAADVCVLWLSSDPKVPHGEGHIPAEG